ncbi:DMT family transporter [Candidatus Dependentiae bacterium]|jgi:drug/metabolite transporter (DMT)-like permease|nr:DMT family transporter [Candidatus Dependentiae bacterium]
MLPIIILNALLASTFTLGKVVLNYTKPVFFVGMSMVIGGIILFSYQLFTARHKLIIQKKDLWLFFQVSFFTIFLSYVLQFWGMNYMPSSKACLLYNFGPFTSYLIAYLFFKEKMSFKKWAGLTLGFIGLFPILMTTTPREEFLQGMFFISFPEIAVIISAAAYSYGWFIIRELVHERHYSPLTLNGYSMLTGGTLALCTVPVLEGPIVIHDFYPFFGLLASTIIIEYMICNNLYARLLDKYSETFLSLTTFSIPVFGGFYGWIFLNERISWNYLLSCLILFIAIRMFSSAEKGGRHRPKKNREFI